ncbi:MAG: hypothetical protein CMF52_07630 [Legionellales bacterium]|nr:hypothetical protein [Legionellales bacterium]HAV93348.1 hypothetical protein [Pseudomonadota bacterium]
MRKQLLTPVHWTSHNGLDISYVSDFAMNGFISDIFQTDEHRFVSQTKTPYVIDAGANTGCVTLYLKQLYPHADILCFEPDYDIFQLLQSNILRNQLLNVQAFNCALGAYDGVTHFYTSKAKHLSGGLGNSIKPVWGIQEHLSQYDTSIKVPLRRLSTFINRPVDYLKLDVEGAESDILSEISHRLHLVKQLHVEVHCLGNQDQVLLTRLTDLLERHQFSTDVAPYHAMLPDWIKRWTEDTNPSIWNIKATNLRYL